MLCVCVRVCAVNADDLWPHGYKTEPEIALLSLGLWGSPAEEGFDPSSAEKSSKSEDQADESEGETSEE